MPNYGVRVGSERDPKKTGFEKKLRAREGPIFLLKSFTKRQRF